MFLSEISPFVRQAIIGGVGSTYRKSDIFRHLRTPDCRLFYILNGTGKIKFRDVEYELQSDSAIIFQSGTEYIWDTNHTDIISINFDYTMNFTNITRPFHPIHSQRFDEKNILENVIFEDADILNKPLFVANATTIAPMLRTITSTFHINDSFSAEMITSYMKAIITTLVYNSKNSIKNSNDASTNIVNKIIEYIQKNYNQNISNKEIAEKFHFNHSYIGRIFKSHTGVSIHQFLLDYRMNIAKELLRTQNSSIHSIAHAVGFNDSHHFVKYFKQSVGKTPTEYRRSNIQ